MARCEICGKGKVVGRIQRHKRGVAGAQWTKRAPKKVKVFKPNLHKYQGKYYCTKCLRKYKKEQEAQRSTPKEAPVQQPA